MKNFIQLLEELNTEQKIYVDEKLGGKEYNPEDHHKDMFDAYESKNNHITLPYENVAVPLFDVDSNIRRHLARHGYAVHDYRAGLASRNTLDRDGNHKLEVKKIGKILQDTGADKINHPEMNDRLIKGSDGKPLVGEDGRYKSEKVPQSLLHFYNNDPSRSSKSTSNIIISRDKEDIAGMSSGRSWEGNSCMRLPFSKTTEPSVYQGHIKHDFKKGTLIAYSTKHGDDNIERPMGRVLIKAYHAYLPNGEKHTIYRPENKTYGRPPNGFVDQVESVLKAHYPIKEGASYKLDSDLYNDGRSSIKPIKVGLHHDIHLGTHGTTNYNSEGKLHDYVDDNGVKQPAVKYNDGGYIHYNNGLEHNEDGIAHLTNFKSGNIERHMINGEYHKLGAPAVKLNRYGEEPVDGKLFHEEYRIGGLLHRDGDLPAIKYSYNNGGVSEQYYQHGLEHRDNEGISHQYTHPNTKQYHRKTYGLYHTSTDTPSYQTKVFEKSKISDQTTQWHRNGKLHRDEDKPASIELSDNKAEITKKWYKHGELSRENGKPHTIVYDRDTKKVKSKIWDRPYGSDKPFKIDTDRRGITVKSFNRDSTEPESITTNGDKKTKRWLGTTEDDYITLSNHGELHDLINSVKIHPSDRNPNHTFISPFGTLNAHIIHGDGKKYHKVLNSFGNDSTEEVKKILQKGMESPIPEISRFYKSHYDKLKHL